jgi:hypothetical protein
MDESNGREPTDAEFLTDEHRASIALLTDSDIVAIDSALLGKCDRHWRKVAYVVGSAMQDQTDRAAGVPDVFYAQRVRCLVQQKLLESAGNLAYMRYSEVRVPQPGASA